MKKDYDFGGWATKNDLKCVDGRTIRKDAFKGNDGTQVPLVWNHQHGDVFNVLGHAILENREDGVYAYGWFNDTTQGENAKELVVHKDVDSLSIWANQLKQQGGDVLHGVIREVSLVLAGANPGAVIDNVIAHGDDAEPDEATIYSGIEGLELAHSADSKSTEETGEGANMEPASGKEETVADVLNSLNEKQQDVVYALLEEALGDTEGNTDEAGSVEHSDETTEEDNSDSENDTDNNQGGENVMKHNVFDESTERKDNTQELSHSDMEAIITDAKKYGSLKESVLAHGITDINYLFPDAKTVTNVPTFIKREDSWVSTVMNGVHLTPFSRIKSIFADITEADARARGYIKGKQKVDEVFSLLKRSTTPQTIYKKQKLDRDDVIDITDFDVVAWLKSEMRMMLDEEIARAVLVGDGRLASSDDKINESNIRPVWKDDDLYTIKTQISVATSDTDDAKAKAFIKAAVKSRKNYKGSGNPTLYTTEDVLTDCLLLEDTTGRRLYANENELATAMRVKNIVTVPAMENLTRTTSDSKTATLMGIIVNLNDYNIGADKGGAVNMFDDFDIDYNAQKYLIETRCSGALIVPYSAIAIESVPAA